MVSDAVSGLAEAALLLPGRGVAPLGAEGRSKGPFPAAKWSRAVAASWGRQRGGLGERSASVRAALRLPERTPELRFPGRLSISGTYSGMRNASRFFLLVFIRYSSDLSHFPQRRKLRFSSANAASTLKKCQKHSKHMYDPVLV